MPSLSDGTDFGTATLATGQVTHTFTIANLGTRVLQLNGSTRVQVTGVNPADFVVTTLPSASVPIGGTTTFSIRFDPSGIGLRRARVAIANDDANENPYVFDIQGTGTNAAPVLNNSGTPYLNEVSEDDLANMGTTVPELLGRGAGGDPISDADNDPEGIAVTGVNASLGTWQYSLNGGATWTNIGALLPQRPPYYRARRPRGFACFRWQI